MMLRVGAAAVDPDIVGHDQLPILGDAFMLGAIPVQS
jgi:hypothetical protein